MKEMYKGKVNSPATLLVETIDSSVTSIKVADGSVFPEGPNVAVIGTDGNAETIKYDSINGNILVGCVRGFQGKASVWDKDTIIARNFTEYDLDVLQENILELDKKQLKDFKEDINHRTVTDSEKEKWNEKVDQSQITGDVNASGSDKVYHVDFIKKQLKQTEKQFTQIENLLNDKVPIEQGKNLSSNDFTDDLKNKLENIEDGANKITKVSQLNNDKNFKTESEIKTLINNSTKLKKEVVTSLPSTGKDDVIYLLKNKNDTNNYYTEYMWISGRWEIIGDTKVDLSDYAKKSEIPKIDLSKLDEKYLQYKSKMLEDIDLNTFDEYGIFLCNANACKNPPEYFIDSWFPFYLINEYIIGSDGTKSYYQLAIGMTNNKCVYARQGNKGSWTNWIPLVEEKFTKEEKEKLKKLSSSRSATFVIANYDSSENSKKGADYVIQKNESPCDVINSFIEKLPSYGGKIQLTEGHFIEKNDKNINLNKDNITLSGYGESTNLERTFENGDAVFIRMVNSNIILMNFQSNTKYNNAIWISQTANKCRLFNISGTSINNAAWGIQGSNNTLSNCSGTSTKNNAIYISGSNNTLSNCSGTSTNGNAFQIKGTGISLIGCKGETKSPNTSYDISFASETKSCIVLGNHYYAGGLGNKGTNNVIANNVKLEV